MDSLDNSGEGVVASPESIMHSRHFRRGFQHARVGRRFDPMDTYDRGDQEDYEFGRLFAAACPSIKQFKRGRSLVPGAVYEFYYRWERDFR